jgi:phosphate transport system substrate-binding protein
MLAISDGPADMQVHPNLVPRPLAMSVFALIVPSDLTVNNLGSDQIQALFAGNVANWQELGGPNQPVRVVSRPAGSGTLATLQLRLLDGKPLMRDDLTACAAIPDKNPPGPAACEAQLTSDMIKDVAMIPGAIGFSEVADAQANKRVATVTIHGSAPTREEVDAHHYPFWGVEFAYSNGELPAGSLADAFLGFLIDETAGKDIIRSHGNTPCQDLSNRADCSPNP